MKGRRVLSEWAVSPTEHISISFLIPMIIVPLICLVMPTATHVHSVDCTVKPKPWNIVPFTRTDPYSANNSLSYYLEHIYLSPLHSVSCAGGEARLAGAYVEYAISY